MGDKKQQEMKLFEFGNTLAQLMWLNVLTLVCSVPVITVGASASAMHYVLIHVLRDGKESVTKCFFRSFKKNFGQATVVWLVYLLIFALLGVDYLTMKNLEISQIKYVKYFVPVIAFIVSLSLVWVFVIISRYNDTIKQAFLFAITRVIAYPLRTVLMVVTFIVPIVVSAYFPVFIMVNILLGIAGCGYVRSCLYSKALLDMEDDSQH